jgi:hypothetical protein
MESLATTEEARKTAVKAAADAAKPANYPQTMFGKVAYLRWYGAVSQRNDHVWMVDGVHSTYAVREAPGGTITCDCEGFKVRGVCSHSIAVVMIVEKERLEGKVR